MRPGWPTPSRPPTRSRSVRDRRRGDRLGPALAGPPGRRAVGRHPLAGCVRRAGGARPGSQVALFNTEYARAGAPQPVNRVGINLAGPTLLAHGTDDQRARWVPSILDASEIWCQLFSSPTPAATWPRLRTIAARDESIPGWRLNGQKVWTSYATFARWGICLRPHRRRGPAQAHAGISYLVVDMEQPGIEIRPLRQITGEPEFNEVFLDDVVVPDHHLVGPLHGGWAVAQHHAGPRAGHGVPVQGAGGARAVRRRPVAGGVGGGPARRRGRRRRPDPVAGSRCACCGCTTGATAHPAGPGRAAGARVEPGEAGVDRRHPAPLRRRPRRARPGRLGRGPVGPRSGCGRRRRRSPAAPARSRRRSRRRPAPRAAAAPGRSGEWRVRRRSSFHGGPIDSASSP